MAKKKRKSQSGGRRGAAAAPDVKACEFQGCGRPLYARRLCQTHHRQLLSGEPLGPVRPYRARTPGTQKFAGLRLSSGCVESLKEHAGERELSFGAVISELLERWYQRGAKPERPSPHGSGARA